MFNFVQDFDCFWILSAGESSSTMWRLRHSQPICLSNLDVSISTSQKIRKKKTGSPMCSKTRKEEALWQKSDALLQPIYSSRLFSFRPFALLPPARTFGKKKCFIFSRRFFFLLLPFEKKRNKRLFPTLHHSHHWRARSHPTGRAIQHVVKERESFATCHPIA